MSQEYLHDGRGHQQRSVPQSLHKLSAKDSNALVSTWCKHSTPSSKTSTSVRLYTKRTLGFVLSVHHLSNSKQTELSPGTWRETTPTSLLIASSNSFLIIRANSKILNFISLIRRTAVIRLMWSGAVSLVQWQHQRFSSKEGHQEGAVVLNIKIQLHP